MPGELPGVYFKLVIGSMLTADTLFPHYKRRVEEMSPEAMYPWDEYCEIVRDIASNLSPAVVVSVGRKVVTLSKETFLSQGFTTADSILSDFSKLFSANIVGAPAHDMITTIRHEPGYALLRAGTAQPAKLVEGYLRGVVEMYGGTVTGFSCTPRSLAGHDYHEVELRYR